jgi:hypothetical protein
VREENRKGESMNTEEIIAVSGPAMPSGHAAVSIHLKQGEGAEHALEVLFDLLGDDSSIAEVDVVIAGERVGTLGKQALYGLVKDLKMSIGDGSLAVLPGDPAPTYVRMHCPTQSCKQRAIIAPDLYSTAPVCPLHHCAMVVHEGQ